MAWLRYLLYFLMIALASWILTQLEAFYPGSLRLHEFAGPADTLGTSEFSPIEIIQPFMLLVCVALMGSVAQHCPSQRPLAIALGGVAFVCIVRELDYFLDRYLVDNLWQVLIGITVPLIMVYTFRQRRRFLIALARIWPSPGLALMFAGTAILFAFVQFVGHEPLWQAILGDDYRRVAKLAVEEFIELSGYLLWLVGSIEYTLQARSIAMREPEPAAVRRRRQQRRRQD